MTIFLKVSIEKKSAKYGYQAVPWNNDLFIMLNKIYKARIISECIILSEKINYAY